jgi:hypothetical protein
MIRDVQIFPNYHSGFTFIWKWRPELKAAPPWTFTVEESDNGHDAWHAISPPLVNLFSWTESTRVKYNKDLKPYFRIKGLAGGQRYYSDVRFAFGDLNRRDWLLTREIMRKEFLQMRLQAGVPVNIWQRMGSGVKCTVCRDCVTDEILDPNCPSCRGTGFVGGYHGPYHGWATFSVRDSEKKFAEGGHGVDEDVVHQVRVLGSLILDRDDLIQDTPSQRIYVADKTSTHLVEIRRIPVVQTITVHELAPDRVTYSLSGDLLFHAALPVPAAEEAVHGPT